MRRFAIALAFALALGGLADIASAQKKAKIKDTVEFATSWDAAVAEAKLLNVPIVLHSHGYY